VLDWHRSLPKICTQSCRSHMFEVRSGRVSGTDDEQGRIVINFGQSRSGQNEQIRRRE